MTYLESRIWIKFRVEEEGGFEAPSQACAAGQMVKPSLEAEHIRQAEGLYAWLLPAAVHCTATVPAAPRGCSVWWPWPSSLGVLTS